MQTEKGTAVELQGDILNMLFDMHRFHMETVRQLSEQRIHGMTIYVAGIAALTAFYINQGNERATHIAYRGLVGTATVLVLVFQAHWWFYTFENLKWSDAYFDELETQLVVAEADVAGGGPHAPFLNAPKPPGTASCGQPHVIDPCWRTHIETQLAADWCAQNPSAPRQTWRACRSQISSLNILTSPRQLNVWTLCIVAFCGMGFWYSVARERRHR